MLGGQGTVHTAHNLLYAQWHFFIHGESTDDEKSFSETVLC